MNDPVYDFYEWARRYRRRQRVYQAVILVAAVAAAWAVLVAIGLLLAFVFVTFA